MNDTDRLLLLGALLVGAAAAYFAVTSHKKRPALIGGNNARLPGVDPRAERDTDFGGGGDYGPTGGDF